MKNKKKMLCLLILFGTSLLGGCEKKNDEPLSTFDVINYDGIQTLKSKDEIDEYISQVSVNDSTDKGIIISPYHTIKINGIDVPLYASRAALGIHSFVHVNVNESKVNLNIEITSSVKKFNSVDVLPLSSEVKAQINEYKTTANITDFGNFSFAFNGKSDYAITVQVLKKEEPVLPEGYKLKEISPKEKIEGVYPLFSEDETNFTEENTLYYFKKGHYNLCYINVPSNSILYFEPGTYIEDSDEYKTGIRTRLINITDKKNVAILGNGLFDFSKHYANSVNGGDCKFDFAASKTDGIKVRGMIFINASSWQMTFTDCDNVEVYECMLIGYKTCSDGIMLADCKHGYVHHNFARTGDDAIEAKSTGTQGGEDLLYEYNAVWADKARCYGVIFECNNDAHNIIFRHNSVGFSQSCWCDDCAPLMVLMGNNKEATWYDIHFEDFEIYFVKSHAIGLGICKTLSFAPRSYPSYGGQAKDIFFNNIRVYNQFFQHEELLYVKVEEECSLKNVQIENFTYYDFNNNVQKFTNADLNNILMTDYWVYNNADPSSIITIK